METQESLTMDGLDVLNIKIVRSVEEIDDPDCVFKPEMCHQIFGQQEMIYGYKDLEINLIFDAMTFNCLVTSSYSYKVKTDPVTGLGADDYMEKLIPWLPNDYFTDKEKFIEYMKNSKQEPHGKKLTTFSIMKKRCFEIRYNELGEGDYGEMHKRLESLIMWFIDAASAIDTTDNKWRVFVLYERIVRDKEEYFYPIGFATVYEYYAYPDRKRYRVSQFIIYPPYQRLGLGTELLRNMYKYLYSIEKIVDITVEDPAENFQALRDVVDVMLCKTLPSFSKASLKAGFSKAMIKEAKENYKLCEKQIRRVFEILKLSITQTDPSCDIEICKEIIRKRLRLPYEQREMQNKRLKLFSGAKSEVDQTIVASNMKAVEDELENTIEKYSKVLKQVDEWENIVSDVSHYY